ncbi:amidohydrolase family protein [soil metagenome]
MPSLPALPVPPAHPAVAHVPRPAHLAMLLATALLLSGCGGPDRAEGTDSSGPLTTSGWTVIEGGWMFEAETGERVPNPWVHVGPDGRIHGVGSEGQAAPSGGQHELIRLDDAETLLPGLIDLHAHYNMDLTGDGRVEESRWNPLVYLANGVTTTFPAGEYLPEQMLQLRDRIEAGTWDGPRILPSGPYFGSSRPGWNRDITREELHAEVDEWWERGVRHFKAKGAGPDHVRWLVERVHELGGTVTGHVDSGARGSTNSVEAIEAGIDRIEHILGGYVLDREQAAYPVWNQVDTTSAAFRRTVDLFLERGIHFNPTITAPVYFTELEEGFDDWADERTFFTPYIQDRVAERIEDRGRPRNELMSDLYQAMKRSTLAFYNAGGGPLITLGTDNPSGGEFLPGFSAHRELHAMVLAGMPPASALQSGTLNGARALGMDDDLGSIAPGKWADLFLVRGNPVEDIRATREVQWVMREGRRHDPVALLSQARGQIGPAGPDDHDGWWRW